jgi:hypothetical protein
MCDLSKKMWERHLAAIKIGRPSIAAAKSRFLCDADARPLFIFFLTPGESYLFFCDDNECVW